MKPQKTQYRRNLPHLQPKNGVFALTICLSGTLPKAKIQSIKDARELKVAEIKMAGLPKKEEDEQLKKAHFIYFGKFDALLDGEVQGPTWLSNPTIAEVVREGLHYRDGKMYKLVAYCIMSNHIHLIIYKCEKPLYYILERYKGYTGLHANNIIYGQPAKGENRPSFWQDESYDRLIRDRREFYFQVQYALNNPVKAGLVARWTDWKFSFLREEFRYIMP